MGAEDGRSGLHIFDADDEALGSSTDRRVAVAQLRAAMLPPERAATRAEVVEMVETHADIAHRRCRTGHLTGSALVVDSVGSATLLMLHTKLGLWLQPGGHADGDTNLAAVALREATEETGIEGLRVVMPAIDVDIHEVSPPGERPHLHLDVRFLVLAPAGAVPAANEESRDLRWVRPDELDGLRPTVDGRTRRFIETGLEHASALLGR